MGGEETPRTRGASAPGGRKGWESEEAKPRRGEEGEGERGEREEMREPGEQVLPGEK